MVAAEGVVPGQPVDQHRRLLGRGTGSTAGSLLVGADHALRVDHALGQLGRARGEEELGDGVGADLRVRGVDRGGGRVGAAGRRSAASCGRRSRRCVSTTGVVGRHGGGDRAAVAAGRRANTRPGVSTPRMWRSLP